MLYAFYPYALDCGMSSEYFWQSSLQEIEDETESYLRKSRQKEAQKIEQLFVLADAISSRVAFSFSPAEKRDTATLLQPWDIYPQLFEEEKQMAEKADEERELEAYKDARRRHATEWNQKRMERKP